MKPLTCFRIPDSRNLSVYSFISSTIRMRLAFGISSPSWFAGIQGSMITGQFAVHSMSLISMFVEDHLVQYIGGRLFVKTIRPNAWIGSRLCEQSLKEDTRRKSRSFNQIRHSRELLISFTTFSIWASLSSANMGSDSICPVHFSATGKLPLVYPRDS